MNTVVIVSGGRQKHSAMHIHVSILPQSPLPARFLRRRVSICSSRSSTVVPEPKQMSKNWGLEPQDAGFPTEFAFSVLCFGLMSSVCGAWEKMRTSHRSLAIGSTVKHMTRRPFITMWAHLYEDLGGHASVSQCQVWMALSLDCFYLMISLSWTSVDQELGYIMCVWLSTDRLCPPWSLWSMRIQTLNS